MVTAGDVRSLLADRPELAPAVEAVLAADEPFSFDDLAIDSGQFGELVSRGIVEKSASGDYRVADREAVRSGLQAQQSEAATTDSSTSRMSSLSSASLSKPTLPSFSGFSRADKLTAACLLVGLLLVAVFRLTSWPAVFREGQVVLSGNDPYYYRVIVEQLFANPETSPSSLPSRAAKGEPLLVVTLWAVSTLFGGVSAVGGVLAWYPVVSAVVTGLLVYAIAVLVTDDRRVALASVLMLAVLPGHAMRTSLGFADHHAFDYPWLALTLLGIVLATVAAQRHTASESPLQPAYLVASVGAVAVGVTAQVLSWDAGPLLIVAVGLYLAVDGLRAVAADESPLLTSGPVTLGVVLAAGLTWAVHSSMGWHTTLLAASPALLAVGGVGVLVAAELTRRAGLPAWALGVAEVVGFAGGMYLLQTNWPAFWARLTSSVDERLLAYRAIAEVRSLWSQSFDWLLLFGFLLVVALPYIVWSFHRARRDARWLPLGVYAAYFLTLATIQVRFVGELSPVIAVFAGLAFVHLAAWVDATEDPAPFAGGSAPEIRFPSRKTVQSVAVLFLLVAGLSVVQVPLKTNLITTETGQYETAMEIDGYSDDQGLEYPDSYVLSAWGDNRMYNYFVSGEAASYGFAQNNYREFVAGTNGSVWYEKLNRRGFVVTTDDVLGDRGTGGFTVNGSASAGPADLGTRLHANYGSATQNSSGLGHYRLVAANANGTYKAFKLVPGAVVTGAAEPNSEVTVRTDVDVDGTTFTYTRTATTNADGEYRVRVAYPGEYSLSGAENRSRVAVTESAVQNGTAVTAGK
jgi:dolichyl-diphosphooligosaccharide--protein glycosyltransferase